MPGLGYPCLLWEKNSFGDFELLLSAQSPRCRTYRLPDGKFGSRRSRSLVAPIIAISDKSPSFSESGAPVPGRIATRNSLSAARSANFLNTPIGPV